MARIIKRIDCLVFVLEREALLLFFARLFSRLPLLLLILIPFLVLLSLLGPRTNDNRYLARLGRRDRAEKESESPCLDKGGDEKGKEGEGRGKMKEGWQGGASYFAH